MTIIKPIWYVVHVRPVDGGWYLSTQRAFMYQQSLYITLLRGYFHVRLHSSLHGQSGCHFVDDIFRCIFVNETFFILIKISLKSVLKGQLATTQHWFRLWLGSEQAASHYLNQCWPQSLTHICGTRGRWVNWGQDFTRDAWICYKCTLSLRWPEYFMWWCITRRQSRTYIQM